MNAKDEEAFMICDLNDWDALREQVKLEIRQACMYQVDLLLASGWSFELPDIQDSEPWQWYWRSPPKRRGSKGKKHLSTNQAFNALQREMELKITLCKKSC